MSNQEEINIKKEDLMQILELTGLPISSLERLIDTREAERREEEDKKKKNANPPFVQLYKGVGLKALQWLIKENPLAGEIFIFFLDNMNDTNLVMASQQLLTEEFNRGRTTIYKSINFLKKHGFIDIAKLGTANAYIINPDLAFQSGNEKKKYVQFNGSILLSESENKELFKRYKHSNVKVLKENQNHEN